MKSRFVVLIVRVIHFALPAFGLFERESRRARGLSALRRYAGRLIEIERNTRTVMVQKV
ncbi:hypothetical protein [Brevundimonas sp.]|uniref:hypothetical protein n=1 Tax=Brevundimonas sp. TaxID=1871086 RepID=UPI003561CE9E